MLFSDFEIAGPEDLAKAFVFMTMPKDRKDKLINFQNSVTGWRKVFQKNRDTFSLLFSFGSKYGLDIEKYLAWFIRKEYDNTLTPDENLCQMTNINKINAFLDDENISRKHERIYGYFERSANTIAHEAAEAGYRSSKEYLAMLVKRDLIGEYVITGKISIYYLASIENFDKVMEKRRHSVSSDTIDFLLYNFDIYSVEISEAYKFHTNRVCHTFRHTDGIIQAILDSSR